MYRGIISALLFIWASGASFLMAQEEPCNLSISGKVFDEHDRQPLSFAEVYVEELSKGAVVDSAGNYSIKGLCPGEYSVTAFHVGCEPVTRVVKIGKDIANLNFYLEHHQELLEEAEVVSGRIRQSAEASLRLNQRQLEHARGQTIGEAVEQLSGVNSLSTGNSITKPVIHGLSGNRIVTMNHGVRQEDQQWGLEHGINADMYAFDEVSVVKGAAAVEYGAEAIGGVVKLRSEALPFGEPIQGRLYLTGEINGLGGSASARIRQGIGQAFAYNIHLSGKKLGDRSAPDYILSNTGVEELNASAEFGYRIGRFTFELYYSRFSTTLGILRASHVGSLSDLTRAIEASRPAFVEDFDYRIENPRQDLKHDLAKLKTSYRMDANSVLQATYGFQHNQRKEFDIRRGGRSGIPANSLALSTQTLQLDLRTQHSESWSGKYGFSGMLQENTNLPGTGIRPILPNYNRYRGGAFVVEKYRLENWILEAGLRYDYDYTLVQKYDIRNQLIRPEFRFHTLAASIGVTHVFNENIQLSSLLTYAYRPPHVSELMSEGLHHGAATLEYGDSTLIPERSLNCSNTLSLNFPERFRVELTAYLNPIGNYIYLQPQPEPQLTIRGAFPVYRYTQADVLLGGVDLDLDFFVSSSINYHLSGSYVRGYNTSANEDLVLIPAPMLMHSLRYEFAAGAFRNAFVKLGQRIVARQNNYPIDQDMIPPPPGYHLLDFSLGKSFFIEGDKELLLSLNIRNLLNTSYRDYLNRFRYYADNAGINVLVKLNYQF